MDKIALFCKSYSGDLERCKVLSESIKKHNIDQIPFYVSVPLEETMMFQSELPYFTEILADEHIAHTGHGWVGQQHVKANYYKHELSEYYLVIDSDHYFIRDFYVDDFMYDEDIPYMVMNQNEDLYQWSDRFHKEYLGFDPRDGLKDYEGIKKFLDRKGKIYHYGPGPFMWNTEVWKEADDEFGIELLFSKHPNELKWYGELALYYDVDYMPIESYCKGFHYKAQYEFYKQLGWTEEMFSRQFLAIGMQSNWGAPLKY